MAGLANIWTARVAVAGLIVCGTAVSAEQGATAAKPKTERIDPVAVVGCLKESKPGSWTLADASDPTPSSANAASAKELEALPKGGKNQYQLVGVTAFDLAAHREHSVVIKGLPIQATPMPRLNMTSITMVSATCPGSGGK